MLRVACLLSLASIFGLGADCGDEADPATPATQTPQTPGGTNPPATTAKAGKITGSIRDERGNVIAIPGAVFKVHAEGITVSGTANMKVPVNADGTFEADAVGNWQVSAEIEAPFNGKTFVLALAPVQDNTVKRPASEGVVQDFTWKLTGVRTTDPNPDKGNLTHWHGAGLTLSRSGFRADLDKAFPEPPKGTKLELVVTPTQPKLIDGSDAKEKKFEMTWQGAIETDTDLTDIPLGVYELSGTEIGLDGVRTPLVFETSGVPFTPKYPLEWRPDANGGGPTTNLVQFDITR